MQNMMKKGNYFLTRFFPKLSLSAQCCFWATFPKITKKLEITEKLQFHLSFRAKNITFLAGSTFFANHMKNWAIRVNNCYIDYIDIIIYIYSYIELYWYLTSSSWNMKGESNWLPLKKTTLKTPHLIKVKLSKCTKLYHRNVAINEC